MESHKSHTIDMVTSYIVTKPLGEYFSLLLNCSTPFPVFQLLLHPSQSAPLFHRCPKTSRTPTTRTTRKHPPNLLQTQPGRLRKTKNHKQPTQQTKPRIKPKRARRRNPRHQRQIRAINQQIRGPIRCGRQRGAEAAYFEREELALLPGDVSEACGVGCDEEDHGEEDEGGPGVWVGCSGD